MTNYRGKAINPPLEEGDDWERFRVVLTHEFKSLRVKAMELLQPHAQAELDNVSSCVYYFLVDGDENSDDVCDLDDCANEMFEQLKKNNPKSEIEKKYSDDDGDHENLNTCAICGRNLNTQLTWVSNEVEYIEENKENHGKEFFISNAFTLYCILDAIPSDDHDPGIWGINEYKHGNTFHVDLRTEFYEQLMELTNRIVIELLAESIPVIPATLF